MTKAAVLFTDRENSGEAGEHLGRQILEAFDDSPPDAVVLFASSCHEFAPLLTALERTSKPRRLVGASSAGEFTGERFGAGMACALALRSPDMRFNVGVGFGVGADRAGAAKAVVSSFEGPSDHNYPYRTALVMTDALAGHADDLVNELTIATAGQYQFVGGGAGDDAQFHRTHVFAGTEAFTDAVVVLEILSQKPVGIGVSHGWRPASAGLRVTEVDGPRIISLNGMPAIDAFQEHADATGQKLDRDDPLSFFLHNILGIETGGAHRLRVPLAVNDDGSVSCAAEVPVGTIVHVMRSSAGSSIEAAAAAAEAALRSLGEHQPSVALFFDCVATRLRMGEAFGLELEGLGKLLTPASFVGCNSYGQIARAEGQFGGFHNCTAVVCVFPE